MDLIDKIERIVIRLWDISPLLLMVVVMIPPLLMFVIGAVFNNNCLFILSVVLTYVAILGMCGIAVRNGRARWDI